MKRISNNDLRQKCDGHRSKGLHIDSRLIKAIESGEAYQLTIEDRESFLSLVWQEIDDSRLLTPPNQPRSLRDVAQRFDKSGYTFKSLSSPLGLPPTQHQPEWFQKCLQISEPFQFELFGFVTLMQLNDGERRQTPHGTFYIYDGAHKSLVLSALLVKDNVVFQPVDAILLTPRR